MTLDPTALEFRFEVAKALAREAGAVAKRQVPRPQLVHRRLKGAAGLPHRGRRGSRTAHRQTDSEAVSSGTASSAKKARAERAPPTRPSGSSTRSTAPPTSPTTFPTGAFRSRRWSASRSRSASSTTPCTTNCTPPGVAPGRPSMPQKSSRPTPPSSSARQSKSGGTCVRPGEEFMGLLGRVAAAGSAVTRTGSGTLALAYVATGPARRLCRDLHKFLGLPRRPGAGSRSGRLRQRLPRRKVAGRPAPRSSPARQKFAMNC